MRSSKDMHSPYRPATDAVAGLSAEATNLGTAEFEYGHLCSAPVDVVRTYSRHAYQTPAWDRILTTAGQLSEPRRPQARHVHKVAKRLSAEQKTEIIDAYLSPMSALAVAEQFGVSKTSVLRLLRREGVPVRPRHTSRIACH